jgi:hypothetical protein
MLFLNIFYVNSYYYFFYTSSPLGVEVSGGSIQASLASFNTLGKVQVKDDGVGSGVDAGGSIQASLASFNTLGKVQVKDDSNAFPF